ncbi:MAG TPA: site-specific DNA-methyltransferase [Polyangiaceae bacterium]|nr:site-specific DNA-methyltransferase [Polyangiaceae bacterium]
MREPSHQIRLEWPGKTGPRKAPSSALEPRQLGEHGARLIAGDNLHALAALAKSGVRATLAYLDPPFFTGREHSHVERSRGKDGLVRRLLPAFDDRWESFEAYLLALRDRIVLVRELLTDDGCLVLHVDPKTSHYAKVLCDEVFGPRAFASEIVWRYRRWPAKTKNFQRVHDVLLRYLKNPDHTPRFRQLYEPLAASTEKTWGTGRQRAVVDASGRRTRSTATAEATPGTPLGDVWDISIIAPVARQRTGYPTQKPEALLERLVQSCSQEGDLVLDPYTGSGTTLAVCARLGRRSIGIDASPQALAITRARLASLGCEPFEQRVVLTKGRVTERAAPQRVA